MSAVHAYDERQQTPLQAFLAWVERRAGGRVR